MDAIAIGAILAVVGSIIVFGFIAVRVAKLINNTDSGKADQ